MDLGIKGRTAIVAGSTSGLGLAVARALAEEGVIVAFCGRRGELAHQYAAQYSGSIGIEVDLQQKDSAKRFVEAAVDGLGPIDIVVLNSGGPTPGTASGLTIDAVDSAIQTLLVRQIELVSAVLRTMRERGWGRVVGVGSSGIQQPLPGLALSNIARAGLAGYLKTLSGEVAGDGVTVNMVMPGRIATDRVASLDQMKAEREGAEVSAVEEHSRSSIPAGRYGTPEEFGAVAAFLCSAQASYVTGEQVRCDGGLVQSH